MKHGMLNRKLSLMDKIYKSIPLTYYGMLARALTPDIQTVLDVGCGTDIPMSVLNCKNSFDATGVDIYEPYLKECEAKGIYKKLIQKNITELQFPPNSFDAVVCLHVVEHLEKNQGEALIDSLEQIASKKVILAMPIGEFPQDTYDGNKYQIHRSAWFPAELKARGYTVKGHSLKALFGEENVLKKYGYFGYVLFAISTILQPILWVRPEWGVYMIAVKNLRK